MKLVSVIILYLYLELNVAQDNGLNKNNISSSIQPDPEALWNSAIPEGSTETEESPEDEGSSEIEDLEELLETEELHEDEEFSSGSTLNEAIPGGNESNETIPISIETSTAETTTASTTTTTTLR